MVETENKKMKFPVRVFDCQDRVGLFASLYYSVAVAKYCNYKKLTPLFISTNELLVDPSRGSNWVKYFFDYNLFGENVDRYLESSEIVIIKNRRHLNRYITSLPYIDIQNRFSSIAECAELFFKQFTVKQNVRTEVDDFVQNHMHHEHIVGVHYRGTDKHFDEADPVKFEQLVQAVKKYGGTSPVVFLATDDPRLPIELRRQFGADNVIMRREPSGLSHVEDVADNYTKGLDAVVDCLLLSRCSLLIKTPSQLSAWSKVFNLDLELVLLGQPYKRSHNFELFGRWWELHIPLKNKGFFPESALHDRRWGRMKKNGVLEIIPT